ncbi:hypothetical protein GBZ26_03265 [Azospirillum formosense]|uniref:DUF4259 domain-containing protein n=2 Tax=Azospirillum formosense TaxID=861533 RepID=A0ABX2KNS2_9PROT|nr:hypothetical protein [Azospirillum formosense]MBY3752750.1 hypothetical protein [Azospirillum formosense]NUB18246.1 hypothetical protein [Azospirillum formosense]
MNIWDAFPLDVDGLRLAVQLSGMTDEEADATIDRLLDPVVDEMVAKGLGREQAYAWAGEIAAHAGAMQADIPILGSATSEARH